MSVSKRLLALMSALVVALLVVAGCGGGGASSSSSGGGTLTLGSIGWQENVAVANLTKAVLEEDLDYDEVELKTLDVGLLFEGVAGGDLDAFQDVWMPNHEQLLSEVEDEVEHLDPWYEGSTTFGLAVPSYMKGVNSIADLNQSGAKRIIGIEPGAVISEKIDKNVIPDYNLKLEHEPSSTAAMLAEVEGLYKDKEPFVFPPWCPNPMCGEVSGWPSWGGPKDLGGDFDFRYLEDPKNSLGNLDEPAKISAIVNEDLADDEPVAYAFIKNLRLSDKELIALEDAQAKEGEVKGVQSWLKDNRDAVQPAIDAAKKEQKPQNPGFRPRDLYNLAAGAKNCAPAALRFVGDSFIGCSTSGKICSKKAASRSPRELEGQARAGWHIDHIHLRGGQGELQNVVDRT